MGRPRTVSKSLPTHVYKSGNLYTLQISIGGKVTYLGSGTDLDVMATHAKTVHGIVSEYETAITQAKDSALRELHKLRFRMDKATPKGRPPKTEGILPDLI